MSGNQVCIEFLDTVNDRTKRYRRIAFGGHPNMDQGVTEHGELLDHIATRDVDGARQLLLRHIEHSRAAVKAAFIGWAKRAG